ANLRALYGYMWAHPGKKLLFMGGEIAQWREWDAESSLDWHLLEERDHQGVQSLVRDLNRIYRETPALWEDDFEPSGFRWLEPNDAATNVLAFARFGKDEQRPLVCVCNFAPVPRHGYRLGLPLRGGWREALNTDSEFYGGSGWAPSTAEIARIAGIDPIEVIRYDANVAAQPLPSSRPGAAAGALARINSYAHGGYPELLEAIARYNGVEPENVVLGAGADDVI